MNTLDIIVLIIISVMTFYGVWKGFIKQALGIVGIIVGYIVATRYYTHLSAYIKLSDPNLSKILSFVILFLACVIIFSILAVFLNKLFKLPGLGMINTFLGGVTGFLKGFILIAITVIILIALLTPANPLLSKSITVPYILKCLMAIENTIPRDIKAQYHKKTEDLIKSLPAAEPAKKKK
jgi:membrane protein required for colicin V production